MSKSYKCDYCLQGIDGEHIVIMQKTFKDYLMKGSVEKAGILPEICYRCKKLFLHYAFSLTKKDLDLLNTKCPDCNYKGFEEYKNCLVCIKCGFILD